MATVTITYTVVATMKCSKAAAKAYDASGDEAGFEKLAEKAESFLQRLPDAISVDVEHAIDDADTED